MRKTVTVLMAGLFLFGLTSPVFADSFGSDYPNCASLDGFVTNADDSTGDAKICLMQFTTVDFPTNTPKPGAYTLEQISEYCSQFHTNMTFEKDCIDDYLTVDDYERLAPIAIFGIIMTFSGVIVFSIGVAIALLDDKYCLHVSDGIIYSFLLGGLFIIILSIIPVSIASDVMVALL